MIYLFEYQMDTIHNDYTFFALNMASSMDYEPVRLAKIICSTEVTCRRGVSSRWRRAGLRQTAIVRSVT